MRKQRAPTGSRRLRSVRGEESACSSSSEAELRELIGEPKPRSVSKERKTLHAHDRAWLAASPSGMTCVIVVNDEKAYGACDVSPKGDPPGFTTVLDDTTSIIRSVGTIWRTS